MKDDRHGNRLGAYKPDAPIDVRKVPANSVPYGESISRNGLTVWVVMDGDSVASVGATSQEVRRKYRDRKRDEMRGGGSKS